ncbi:Uncharacterized protein predicted to be involved in DNA repair [Geoglobus ahangari]|uniref:Uncharacterized protein predicted to be involved in DNA repair n=1 Tax=Geoglobus ahangari TaxID=113653 RepID=A0A0F7IDB1_9EURY|nr:TM1812 family CRISPR-associated protein [Geoglobus ahangari]AKG91320.1 Uncharacterized protein predicted to be involved in DNA repair [Geoglobus ahangari]
MTTIFQVIGRPEFYQENEFTIGEKTYKTCLCSNALREHLNSLDEDTDLTIFVPESILLGESLESFQKKLGDIGVTDFEAAVIPSVGRYMYGGREIEFRGNVEAITTAMFVYLLKKKPDSLIIDLSTGFNIYPVSLLEATKRYLTFRKMERILQGMDVVRARTTFSPPISRDVQRYNVEIQPIDVKAFFALPKADIDKIVRECPGNLRKKLAEINRENSGIKKVFRRLYEELTVAYNALRLNVPLAFYELLKMDISTDTMEKGVLEFVEKFLEPVKSESGVERFPLDGVNISNIFYAIAMFRSLKEFKNSLGEPEVGEILEKFSGIYRNKNLGVGVNEYFLQRDIEEIVSYSDKLREGEEEILGILKHGKEFCRSKVEKRNFFAHSGFLQEFTVVKKENGRVKVGWLEDRLKEVKSWILNPEKN